jgi:aminoglycoside phosphotransferase (APT) family kinase protein
MVDVLGSGPGGPADEVPPEVAPVRVGEELDWDSLDRYLRPRLELDGPLSVLQFPNGSANLTYLVRFGDRRLVLRRPPFGRIAPGAHDMRREHRVLSRLWQAYDQAPRSYLFCEDHSVVGSDFVVLEYRTGEVVWSVLPPSMRGHADAPRRIGLAVVDALADLHLVDPAAVGLDQLGRPAGYLERQVHGWQQRWHLVATDGADATMCAVGAVLARTMFPSPRPAIVHNDFKPDNCQFTPGEPDRVTSVFDWDQATLGDPLADLGTLLNYWPDPSDGDDDRAFHVPGLETLGLPPRQAVVERYAERTGADVDGIARYEAFACWKTAVVLQQLHQRYVRGETTDERMATRGRHVAMLARRAERILGESDQ